MSTARVFRGTRVLLEAAKAATKHSSSSSTSSSAATAAATAKKKPPTGATTKAAASRSKSTTAAAKPKPNAKPKTKPVKQPRAPPSPNSGVFKLTPVSPALNDFLGVSESSRSDAVKKVWEHIKLNNLQNPANKREIYCDDKLKTLFEGREKVGMLEIARILSGHFVKTG
ncbi:uncharacterized protein [Coffea arabica]|uniref:Uncharacterized protein isoform X1 n=1 Tax=Coffea arabica TaxID=13443 RepID=A0A6P6WE38_COFAR|nr:upstream activation factor subunit spp27-like isoform X1 [Coffea arabica]